ncbi:MAG: hypothetical protein HYV03_07500 [Deltaproteobacteria bacterium]|nr:hypothetical protein [Deltaproteobacteria bacterium]
MGDPAKISIVTCKGSILPDDKGFYSGPDFKAMRTPDNSLLIYGSGQSTVVPLGTPPTGEPVFIVLDEKNPFAAAPPVFQVGVAGLNLDNAKAKVREALAPKCPASAQPPSQPPPSTVDWGKIGRHSPLLKILTKSNDPIRWSEEFAHIMTTTTADGIEESIQDIAMGATPRVGPAAKRAELEQKAKEMGWELAILVQTQLFLTQLAGSAKAPAQSSKPTPPPVPPPPTEPTVSDAGKPPPAGSKERAFADMTSGGAAPATSAAGATAAGKKEKPPRDFNDAMKLQGLHVYRKQKTIKIPTNQRGKRIDVTAATFKIPESDLEGALSKLVRAGKQIGGKDGGAVAIITHPEPAPEGSDPSMAMQLETAQGRWHERLSDTVKSIAQAEGISATVVQGTPKDYLVNTSNAFFHDSLTVVWLPPKLEAITDKNKYALYKAIMHGYDVSFDFVQGEEETVTKDNPALANLQREVDLGKAAQGGGSTAPSPVVASGSGANRGVSIGDNPVITSGPSNDPVKQVFRDFYVRKFPDEIQISDIFGSGYVVTAQIDEVPALLKAIKRVKKQTLTVIGYAHLQSDAQDKVLVAQFEDGLGKTNVRVKGDEVTGNMVRRTKKFMPDNEVLLVLIGGHIAPNNLKALQEHFGKPEILRQIFELPTN